MLRALRDWFKRGRRAPDADELALRHWCDQRQFVFTPESHRSGFSVRGRLGTAGWLLAWGRPERLYVRGRGELWLQADLQLAPELHLMVLDRTLQRRLERAVLDQIEGASDGRVDPDMPPEMRWLVTFPRLDAEQAGWPEGIESVASHPEWLLSWTTGRLAQLLGEPPVRGHSPWVLTGGGGRLELRAGLDEPSPERLQAWLALFEVAMREARRVQNESREAGEPTTLPSLWAVPREEPGPNERL